MEAHVENVISIVVFLVGMCAIVLAGPAWKGLNKLVAIGGTATITGTHFMTGSGLADAVMVGAIAALFLVGAAVGVSATG